MKLKTLMTEYRKNSHCWLSPDGRVILVRQTHDDTARKLLGTRSAAPGFDAVEALWQKGFMRVTYMHDGTLVVNNEMSAPNQQQMAVLRKIAQDGEHGKIEFDSGGMDYKTLWTANDALQEKLNQGVV